MCSGLHGPSLTQLIPGDTLSTDPCSVQCALQSGSYQTQGPSSGNKTDLRETETYTDYYYYCTETKKQIGVNTFWFCVQTVEQMRLILFKHEHLCDVIM